MCCCICIGILSINTATVGFAETSYTVPEGGSVEVCVRVISPDGDLGGWYMGFVEIIPSDSAPPPSTFYGLNEASENFDNIGLYQGHSSGCVV